MSKTTMHQSGEHEVCPNEGRLQTLENTVGEHAIRLHAGDLSFQGLRNDVQSLTEKVGLLINAAWWLIGVLMLGLLTTAGGALIWVIQHMGHA